MILMDELAGSTTWCFKFHVQTSNILSLVGWTANQEGGFPEFLSLDKYSFCNTTFVQVCSLDYRNDAIEMMINWRGGLKTLPPPCARGMSSLLHSVTKLRQQQTILLNRFTVAVRVFGEGRSSFRNIFSANGCRSRGNSAMAVFVFRYTVGTERFSCKWLPFAGKQFFREWLPFAVK